jgi:5-methyltetrahydrofolate--homocysteine methyltransferase
METILSSNKKTVVIGPDQPFTIIGERINPTGRKVLAKELADGDFSRIARDAVAQVEAGAHVLDVNAGIPMIDEPAVLAEAIQLVQSVVDAPISIDSSVVEALKSGLEVVEGKALVNSVTGEEERLEAVLPLVKKHGAAVIAICNDETGISEDPDERFAIAKKILERAMDYGIPKEDVIIDPLIMPVGAVPTAGQQVFQILGRVRQDLGVNTIGGASNVSFGMPNRQAINAYFLSMAIAHGLTSAITNPTEDSLKQAIQAADLLMGHDENAATWIGANRNPAAAEGARARRRRRPRSTSA